MVVFHPHEGCVGVGFGEDKDIIRKLLPLFMEASTKAIIKEEIELIQQEINESN